MLWQPLLCGLNPSFKTNGIATALFQKARKRILKASTKIHFLKLITKQNTKLTVFCL